MILTRSSGYVSIHRDLPNPVHSWPDRCPSPGTDADDIKGLLHAETCVMDFCYTHKHINSRGVACNNPFTIPKILH